MGPGEWNDHMSTGSWWWVPMMIMMLVFIGGIVAIGVTLIRRGSFFPHLGPPTSPSSPVSQVTRQTPQEILAERLARGEIEPDEYRRRLDALST